MQRIVLALMAMLVIVSSGCSLQPASSVHSPLPLVTAASGTLRAGDQVLELHGVNYIRPSSADPVRCASLQFGADGNCPWQLAPITTDLDTLEQLGVNTVRIFLDYYVFG